MDMEFESEVGGLVEGSLSADTTGEEAFHTGNPGFEPGDWRRQWLKQHMMTYWMELEA